MADHIYMGRVIRLIITGLAIEVALFLVAHFGPAFAPLIRVAYFVVALAFLLAIWRERHRSGGDRRQGEDRRQA